MELALKVKCISTFTELHAHGDECWPMEVKYVKYVFPCCLIPLSLCVHWLITLLVTSPPGEVTPPVAPPSVSSQVSSGVDINSYPRPSVTRKAKVLYDYDASEKDELSLLADEVSFGIFKVMLHWSTCNANLQWYDIVRKIILV